jgi:hypothetical protein
MEKESVLDPWLEEKSARGTTKDEEKSGVGGSEGRVVWREGDIDMFAAEEGCGAVWLGFRRRGFVREPESMEESLERNCCEESLAKVGNKDGRIKEEPKTASATEGSTGHGVWICRK